MNRVMKPGPFRQLLERANAVGIDTTGYGPEEGERLERRVNEREVQQGFAGTSPKRDEFGRTVQAILDALGWPRTLDNAQHVRALIDSAVLLQEREAKYKGLWKNSGANDNSQNLYSKAQRVKHVLANAVVPEQAMEAEDDLLDIINYASFTLRNVRAGRLDETPQGVNGVSPDQVVFDELGPQE